MFFPGHPPGKKFISRTHSWQFFENATFQGRKKTLYIFLLLHKQCLLPKESRTIQLVLCSSKHRLERMAMPGPLERAVQRRDKHLALARVREPEQQDDGLCEDVELVPGALVYEADDVVEGVAGDLCPVMDVVCFERGDDGVGVHLMVPRKLQAKYRRCTTADSDPYKNRPRKHM